ncbi:hypothetical protein F4560_003232 [Saccharothrix ecbatanensis]|uniref:Uncharacterized protein n=1 Tax=Saccharothrix ecbatanensis TaxID=1105145 RepID=A0A7W9HJJ0_9PSEU|nr:hypothetical protein [Saccharothrix ecbatanensis]
MAARGRAAGPPRGRSAAGPWSRRRTGDPHERGRLRPNQRRTDPTRPVPVPISRVPPEVAAW